MTRMPAKRRFALISRQVLVVPTIVFLSAGPYVLAQSVREVEVRKVEDQERRAVLRKDVEELRTKLWSTDLVVHSPANTVGSADATIRSISEGRIDYSSFERKIEKITFNGDLAIVMGEESLRPQGNAPNAGKTVTRRYTNLWQRSKGRWRLIAQSGYSDRRGVRAGNSK